MNILAILFPVTLLAFIWLAWWLRPCPKERLGYTCHHQIMSNGKKECGEE